jgi:hypothetical protein
MPPEHQRLGIHLVWYGEGMPSSYKDWQEGEQGLQRGGAIPSRGVQAGGLECMTW